MRKTAETQAGSDFVFLFYTSGERAPGDGGTDPPSQERSAEPAEPPSLQAAPPLLVPRASSCTPGTGARSPCEAHVERRAGEGAVAAVSLFPARWFLLGKSREPCLPSKESQLPCAGALRQMDGWAGGPPSHRPSGTCGVRGLPSVRFQLVAGLRPPRPLRLQGCSPAAWIWGPCSDSQGRPGM